MSSSREETIAFLQEELGGTVVDLRRLSGGASRVTSSFRHLAVDGTTRELILQQYRSDGVGSAHQAAVEAELLERARRVGVPVPGIVAVGVKGETGAAWLIVEHLEGETIARRILRDPQWNEARRRLTDQCAAALAAIHRIEPSSVPGLTKSDPLRWPLNFLDALGEVRPALELGARWLVIHPLVNSESVTVHGDFRMGNLMISDSGLAGVLDWELAHAGDPAEDLGWLSAPAWRFGGVGEVGGFGDLEELLAAYLDAGGVPMDIERVRWFQIYATVKWATICALQASAHLSGTTRSVELAAIGRRVCESEWDLFGLLGVDLKKLESPLTADEAVPVSPFGRPTDVELLDAVAGYLEAKVMERTEGAEQFEARIARNVVLMVQRQQRYGSSIIAAHQRRLGTLDYRDDASLAAAIRLGVHDQDLGEVATQLCASARDQLIVANPAYLQH